MLRSSMHENALFCQASPYFSQSNNHTMRGSFIQRRRGSSTTLFHQVVAIVVMVVPIVLLLLSLSDYLVGVEAFSTPGIRPFVLTTTNSVGRNTDTPSLGGFDRRSLFKLYAINDDDQDDDDDDDDDDDVLVDDASLGDWRKFRASLIDGGLPSASVAATTTITDGYDDDSDSNNKNDSTTTKSSAPIVTKPKSVAIQNEALLAQQNQELAEEYRTGIWAHTIGIPEVGGLLCRMPVEAELYYHGTGYWKEKLDIMLGLEEKEEQEPSSSSSSSLEDDDALIVTKVEHWFKLAERMIARELQSITESPKIQNGVLNPNELGDSERDLLDRFLHYKSTWQEICLLLSDNPELGRSEAVIINRPISKNINKPLATLLIEGSDGRGKGSFSYDFVDQIVQAFGKEAAVYMGGPDQQDQPALLLHGISNLRGSREIAPGTGIYQGGWEDAVDGVLQGIYKPLDFRFFLGRQIYDPKENPDRGPLAPKVQRGSYQPVACARSLALKQCLGLPKPLWHEVLELCGGEMKALSTIELKKRIDLQQ